MKVLPGDALGVGDPVFVAAGVAAGGSALIQQRHVSRLGARLELCQLLSFIHLEAQMVQPKLVATGRDREVHPRLIEHPLGVIAFHAGRFCAKELGVEGDVLGQIIDMHVDVEAFHRVLR